MSQLLWIDAHIHVCDIGPGGEPRPSFFEDLIAVLDQDEADLRMILSPDGARMGAIARDAEAMMQGCEFIHDLAQRAPSRLYGSCMVNPNFPDESLRVMDRCFEDWGFVQLGELLPYSMDFVMDSPGAERVVRHAVQHAVPVQVHLSTSNAVSHSSSWGMIQLEDLCNLVDRVPEATYILAHAVGMPDADPPVVDAYLDYIDERYGAFPANFRLEIRDFNSPGVKSALQRVPVASIIAGTDWVTRGGPPFLPYGVIFGVQSAEENPYPPRVATLVALLREAGADEETVARIGSRNAMELFGITP